MTSNTAPQDAAVADRTTLAGKAYADGRHLAARQSIYRWQHPQYDLPGLVTEELAEVNGTVLDIGCGNGKFVSRLHQERPDLRVVGVDISAGILADVAKPVLVADAQALPFTDGIADAMLALHMLYHVRDIAATVKELARVLRPGGLLVASTNSDADKRELDQLWARAAGDVLGVPEGPARVSLSSRFSLEKAPAFLAAEFSDVRVRELPGIIEVTDPAPVVAHLASYDAWAEQGGVPFQETVVRAQEIVAEAIANEGCFRISCRGGILVCAS
ncbi:SAM-dependent methyltransferase [Kitasatospora sp. GP30]|uniref:class I SAM-dependent methyltransferase n=1 Tax=Kitasatospora sp. GP30 TaxID=3035084 RepID=UPI000C709389|nr:class I SAM-dependent methyltransferase [Kitasatospora sp. GP30]MDH6145390.1 SAM-dependent methyltransferase [Kitasatospora sp. GP30]